MPTSEFEKKIHRWASLICCFGSYRCLVRVGSICNLLELDLQMPGRGRKHLQLAGIGFVDAWSGSEASANCWNWICRCLVGVGSICNLLELDLQMPGWSWKHLQFVGIGFADAWPGLEASAICWNWICRCISWVRKHLQLAGIGFVDAYPGFGSICNLLELDLQMHILGSEASATCWNWICRCLVGVGSIHNLLDMNLQMPITKLILRILQQLRWDCFLCRKKSKMFSWTCGAYCAKI